MPDLVLTVYCVVIVLASLAGGWLPSVIRLTHIRMQVTMSLIAGLMLGVALLHMLPLAAEKAPIHYVSGSALGGVLVMFFLLRVFHVHHYHDVPDDEGRSCPAGLAHEPPAALPGEAAEQKHEPGNEHETSRHQHGHGHEHSHDGDGAHQLTWTGLLVGLAIHTLLDGIALGASVTAAASQSKPMMLAGLGTFLAVALHKPLDALSITALMRAGGWPAQSRTLVNVSFALMCPLGALLFRFGAAQIDDTVLIGCALGFSAGFFLCIALGDLLPEVAFHSHDRGKLSGAMLVGVLLSIGVEMIHYQAHGSHPHRQQQQRGEPQQQQGEPRQ